MVETPYSVYKHTSPTGKVYIGITCLNPKQRWGNGKNYSHNKYFSRAINKYGWDSFKHDILFCNLSKESAKQKEIELMSLYDSTNPKKGFNLTKGGESANGYCHTREAKIKIGLASKGRASPMKGKSHSEETKNRISVANKGRPGRRGHRLSEEHKIKIGLSNKGIPRPKSREHAIRLSQCKVGTKHSEETKRKMSLSRLRWCAKNGDAVLQISLDGNVLNRWDNQAEAIRCLDLRQSTFQLHVSNGKPLRGFIYIKEKDYKYGNRNEY